MEYCLNHRGHLQNLDFNPNAVSKWEANVSPRQIDDLPSFKVFQTMQLSETYGHKEQLGIEKQFDTVNH